MADQRRIEMKMSGKPEEEAWIQVINGKRANASGGFVKTKADLLKMKKYMGMVTQKVRDAYNKRLAELSKSKSADSIDAIAAKYGHKVQQNDVNSYTVMVRVKADYKAAIGADGPIEAEKKVKEEVERKIRSVLTIATTKVDVTARVIGMKK